MTQSPVLLIDDFSNPDRMSALGTFWRGFTDQVTGSVSTAAFRMETLRVKQRLYAADRSIPKTRSKPVTDHPFRAR